MLRMKRMVASLENGRLNSSLYMMSLHTLKGIFSFLGIEFTNNFLYQSLRFEAGSSAGKESVWSGVVHFEHLFCFT